MLDFLYNMTLKLLKNRIFDVSMSRFAIFFAVLYKMSLRNVI